MKQNLYTSKYLSLATQMFVTIGIMVYLGWWIDKKLNWKFPLFTISLPFIVIVGILVKIILESNNSKK
ncbi:MAG: AtpZ/AtpI family protein [Chitinophagaceae bacterium]